MSDRNEIMARALRDPIATLAALGHRLGLFEFLQVFWSEVSEDNLVENWHMEYLCGELEKVAEAVAAGEKKERDLVINIPPGTTKTIICSIMFPAWCWSRWPWMRFICASYSQMLSLESAEKSRDLIRSDRYKAIFPGIDIKEDKDTKGNFRCVYRKGDRKRAGGMRFSTSVGGTLTGYHAHILIVDDPLNPQQAASEKELENCNRWMEQTLPTRKTDKDVSAMVLVMQRLHESDPTGRLVEKKAHGIHHICLPGEIRNYGEYLRPKELRKYYVDDLLDTKRLSWSALQALEEDLGQYGFAGQVGQNPAPPGGGMFKPDRLVALDSMYEDKDIRMTVRYWDKAASDQMGAYTAGVKMSMLRNRRLIIHDVVRGQWTADVREKMIRSIAEADGIKTIIFMEQEPGSGGKESAEASIRNLMGYVAYADRPTGDKIRRADPFSVQVNNGNVMIERGDWNRAFKDELRLFPFGTYKDQVDAASGAFQMLTKKKEVRVLR